MFHPLIPRSESTFLFSPAGQLGKVQSLNTFNCACVCVDNEIHSHRVKVVSEMIYIKWIYNKQETVRIHAHVCHVNEDKYQTY